MKIKLLILLPFLLLLIGCSDQKDTASKNNTEVKEINQGSFDNDIDKAFNAALGGNLELVKKYVEDGFDVNMQNPGGQTLLMLAGFNGHTDICEYLIEKKADVDIRESDGRTALMFTSTGPFPQTVKLLLKNGADPNKVDTKEHWTPLMFAAAEGQYEVVKSLLDAGADKTVKDIDGDTAESFAMQNKHTNVVKLLREHK